MQLEQVSGDVWLVLGDAVLLSLDVRDGNLTTLTMLMNIGISQLIKEISHF